MTSLTTPAAYGKTVSADTVRFERLLPGPIERVWSFLEDSDKRASWLAAGTIPKVVGEEFELTFHNGSLCAEPAPERWQKYTGVMTGKHRLLRYDPPHVLAFTWDESDPSEVAIELSQAGDRVRLVLTHTRLTPSGKLGVSGGWHTHLAMLEAKLEDRDPPPFWSLLGEVDATYRAGT